MAGYSKLYVVGGLGGFNGYDGVNPIEFLVLVGDADRQWLEPHYFDGSIVPIGRLRVIYRLAQTTPTRCWTPALPSALGISGPVPRSRKSSQNCETRSVWTSTLILKRFQRLGPACGRRRDRYLLP